MSDDTEPMSEYELLRQKNIEENIRKMKELGIFTENVPEHRSQPLKERKVRRTRSLDAKRVVIERRRSKRISGRQIVKLSDEVSEQILGGDFNTCTITWGDICDYANFKSPKKIRKRCQSIGERQPSSYRPSVDDITEDDLKNIVEFCRDKVYSQDGTTCHQCRQKTLDQKTVCRSSTCFGVRGQFCGPCLKNRYGESVALSLKDPEWSCPPCRNMCNCSICRTNAGKLPTGQLTYVAQERGYTSVKDLLDDEDEN